MRHRLAAAGTVLGLMAAFVVVPATAAHATPATVTVGPEQLISGSAGLVLSKEYETVAPTVPAYRSSADAVFVSDLGATGGTALQLTTGAGKPNPGTNPAVTTNPLQGKEYVGRWFTSAVFAASRLTAFDYRTMTSAGNANLAPYLNVELYEATAPAGQRYANLIWTPPASVDGAWTNWDTSNGWKTSKTFIDGITAGVGYPLATITAAITADPDGGVAGINALKLLRANISWGDTAGGYANKASLLDSLTLTVDGDATTYSLDAPYTNSCVSPVSAVVGPTQLSDPAAWAVHTEYQPLVTSTGTATFVNGPAGSSGTGSLSLASGSGTTTNGRGYAGKVFLDRQLPGCTIGNLTNLAYRTYTAAAQLPYVPYLNMQVSAPISSGAATETAILIYSPADYPALTPAADTWTTWTPFQDPTAHWRTVGTIGSLTPGTYTWAAIQAAIPTANVQRGVEIVVGDSTFGGGWANRTLQVDSLTVGVNSVDATFDFTDSLAGCSVNRNNGTKTITLLSDCIVFGTVFVDDDWTFDGNGFTITAQDPPGDHWKGAVLRNAGDLMHVRNLTVTTGPSPTGLSGVCDSGDDRLYGIQFNDADGSVEDVTIDRITQGNGCQEGNGLDITNYLGATHRNVTVERTRVTNYQKTGIRANGNVSLTLTNSYIGRAGAFDGSRMDSVIAANALQIGRGASASVVGNEIVGNDWDTNALWNATAVLIYGASNVDLIGNIITGDWTDVGVDVSDADGEVPPFLTGSVLLRGNEIRRNLDTPDPSDVWGTGVFDETGRHVVTLDGNTIVGFDTQTLGIDPAPGVVTGLSASSLTQTSFTATWTAVPTALSYDVAVDGVWTNQPGLTKAVSSLTAGTVHLVQVRARNNAGPGDASSIVVTTLAAPAPPGAPTDVIALASNAITQTSFGISWNALAGATSYDVLIDGSPVVATGETATATGLTAGTAHLVQVRGVGLGGNGPWASLLVTTLAASPAPAAPSGVTGLVASAVGQTGFSLSWDTALGALTYDIYVDGNLTNQAGTTLVVTGLTPATSHLVQVRARNAAGVGDDAVLLVTTLASPAPPAIPGAVTGLSASLITTTSFAVSWSSVAGATSYDVTIDGDPVTPVGRTASITGLAAGSAHLVQVRAVGAGGNGPWAVLLVVTTAAPPAPSAPGAVTGLVASNLSQTGFDIAWLATAGATSYDVTIDGTSSNQVGLSKTVTGLVPGSVHLIQVAARNASGVGVAAVLLVTTTAAPPAPVIKTSSASVAPRVVVYGKPTTASGRLISGGVGAGDQVVSVWRRNGLTWTKVGDALTNSTGRWALTFVPARIWALRVTAPGFPAASTSVAVSSKVTVTVARRAISGVVAPRLTGLRVRIEIKSARTWKLVKLVRLSRTSTYRIIVTKKGVYRVVMPAVSGYVKGTSRTVRVL